MPGLSGSGASDSGSRVEGSHDRGLEARLVSLFRLQA